MNLAPLPFNALLEDGDTAAIRVFHSKHPKFLDDKIPWLERRMSDEEVRATPIDRDDALLAIARQARVVSGYLSDLG